VEEPSEAPAEKASAVVAAAPSGDGSAAAAGSGEGGGAAVPTAEGGRGYGSAQTQAYLRKLEQNLQALEQTLGPTHPQVLPLAAPCCCAQHSGGRGALHELQG
jgi:hypothetical protein